MDTSPKNIKKIAQQVINGMASKEELVILQTYLQNNDVDVVKNELFSAFDWPASPGNDLSVDIQKKMLATILGTEDEPARPSTGILRHFNSYWMRYAAALIIFAGASAYLLHTEKEGRVTRSKTITAPDSISPGSNKAVLTLADGSTIVLDSASEGQLANQGNFRIIKLADGQLAYKAHTDSQPSSGGATDAYNILATPRGGQYRLVLPDGSRVWLNAASSIRYPVAFNGAERKVTVSGEVYLEIEKDAVRPFKVNIDDNEVEVLGTSFNIMGYSDEGSIVTTLLSGAIKIRKGTSQVLLKPGQQATVSSDQRSPITVQEAAMTEDVVAWKNGLFSLERATIEQVMRQISRWYDVEIVYESHFKGHLTGEIPRSLKLEEVMQLLHLSGVNFRIEGKKLVITA